MLSSLLLHAAKDSLSWQDVAFFAIIAVMMFFFLR